MQQMVYLEDSYKKTLTAKVISITKKGNHYEMVLDQTIFYPQGGGQPSDQGTIGTEKGLLTVTHVRLYGTEIIHEGKLKGTLKKSDSVTLTVDWQRRYENMRRHSAGHVMHEIIMQLIPGLIPAKGEHGKHAFIEYKGTINPRLAETIEKQTNMLIASDVPITTEFVSLEELKQRVEHVPPKLPTNKPLRIIQVQGFAPTPDWGTRVASTGEIGEIKVTAIEQLGEMVRVHYDISAEIKPDIDLSPREEDKNYAAHADLSLDTFRTLILEQQQELLSRIVSAKIEDLEALKVSYFGTSGKATRLIHRLKDLASIERKNAGMLVNEYKQSVAAAFTNKQQQKTLVKTDWFDASLPGIQPPQGHLHIVTQAIMEITDIFARIGFTRVRHPEVDWDYYAFEALNMPSNHPARDEWETFFIEYPGKPVSRHSGGRRPIESQTSKDPIASLQDDNKFNKIVLTPHTSNGQVREMEKGKLPIRMINVAKCYRRQSDVSHVPMFHQFEGLYVDKNVSIGHLKGVFDFFVKQFYGPKRVTRLRPFHFQFTEPSFEVDITCGICLGVGCKLCKEGWLELGGAGMVHPNVLKAGGINPDQYNGFAFGWGVERTYMMKAGTQLDDIRLLYSNDLRFLEQF